LQALPHSEQAAVMRCLAQLREPRESVVRCVARNLRRRLTAEKRKARSGMSKLLTVLHAMPPAEERRLLALLSENDPQLYEAIRRAKFGADVLAAGEDGNRGALAAAG